MATISLRRLTRRFTGTDAAALHELDLDVDDGELVVLVGPSGCGKSTTLRLVAGLDRPDSGAVLLDGRDMAQTPPQDRDVAMVFQGYALYPHLTVRDNMAFPLRMRRMPAAERAKRIEATAAMLGLGRLLDRHPSELSGGERQRVAMGRAIVRAPKAFLFDEPLANLDAALRAELRIEIASLVRRLGTTSLYVTHDQIEAMTMGDRIAVLRAGVLQQLGPPRAIYERPENVFVAGFLGSPPINLINVELDAGAYRARGVAIPAPANRRLPARATAGIRPEHLRVVAASSDDGVAIDARVVAAEPLGAETYLYADVAAPDAETPLRLRARTRGFDAPERGAPIRLAADPNAIHWFDAESGRRLAV